MKGIIYCRVSSAEQVQGTSLENQRESCLQFAKARNIEIVEFFIEKGESATAATRTELIRALDYCKRHRGQIGAFIVWKIDRFARNTVDHYALQAELRNFGTTLQSVTEPIGDNPIGKMTEAILAGYAQFENDIRKQRCEAGMSRKITEGIWPWQPPLGYIQGKKATDRRKNTPDQPDPVRFELVQRGLKKFAKGSLNICSLTRLWNKWGLRTRTGKPVFKQLAERLLPDKYFAGILIDPWTHEEHVGLHAPMITLEEFDRIQYFKNPRARALRLPRLTNNPDFPLRNFVSCICGGPLTGAWHKGRSKHYAYYSCHKRSCPMRNRALQKADLESEFKNTLSQVTPSPKVWGDLREAILAYWHSTERLSAERNTVIDRQLAVLEHRKQNLYQMRLDNEITREEFSNGKRELENRTTELKLGLPEKPPANSTFEADLRRVDRFITRVPVFWDHFTDISHRQAIQRAVYPFGIIYDQNVRAYGTANLSAIFELSRTFRDDKSYLVAGVGRCWNQLLQGITVLARMIEEFESAGAATNAISVRAPTLSRQHRGSDDGYKAA